MSFQSLDIKRAALFFMIPAIWFGPSTNAVTVDLLDLTKIENYPINQSGTPERFFLMTNSQDASQIKLNSSLDGSQLSDATSSDYPASNYTNIQAEIRCDSDVIFNSGSLLASDNKGTKIQFKIHDGKLGYLVASPKVTDCVLVFWNKMEPTKIGGLRLISDTKAFPILSKLNTTKEQCRYENHKNLAPVENLFLTNDIANYTCAQPSEDIQTLESPESGFSAKVESLLGQKLSPDFVKNQNPYAFLDLSKTPQLDAIFVSSLVYRKDFYGTVLTRLLVHHAKKGTIVHVLTTEYMESDKDKAQLREAAKESGNFRFQEYKYYDPKGGLKSLGRIVDNKFRNMHVKMFVTLSKSQPEKNILILGGRNVHDGFLFKEKPDYSKFPELTQYGKEENFIHWSDFEIKIISKKLAESVYAQLMTFWNRETLTQKVTSINTLPPLGPEIPAKSILSSSQPMMRHILSLPYNDGHSLEKLFVRLIDSAQSTVQLSSPYLRPTKEISAALERAAARNVKITIQTRINLEGDTQPWLYTEVNKESINKFLDKAKIYEWTQNSILHSKFLLIDGKVSFVGSVNLSRRSFVQDVENGFLIYNENFTRKMQGIFNNYTSQSHLITEEQGRKFWGSVVVKILQDQF